MAAIIWTASTSAPGVRRGDLSPAELVDVDAGVAARLDRRADRDGRGRPLGAVIGIATIGAFVIALVTFIQDT
jgi:hypothetical protein